jgi:ParB/RepB/Spo0J family partition protein
MTEELPLTLLDERYSRLRIVQPSAERSIRDSFSRLGQLMPIVVCERGEVLAVVDGFKRLTAARALGFESLRGRVMTLAGEAAAIAALVSLNRNGKGLTDLEEAMVVRALCREHGLEQIAVAELLGRHKSWVSRRLSLAEHLAEEVADDVRAGLITTTIAREVARLPRGNQPDVAAAIRRNLLGTRDAARLVTLLAKTSGAVQQQYLLDRPREALLANTTQKPLPSHDPRLGPPTQTLRHRLFAALRLISEVTARLDESMPARWTETECEVLAPVLDKSRGATELLLHKLTDTLGALSAYDAA